MLQQKGTEVTVYILDTDAKPAADFTANLQRLQQAGIMPHSIRADKPVPPLEEPALVIDALFGSGLNRPLEGLAAQIVEQLNSSGAEIVAVDIPSGMYADKSSAGNPVVHARHTVSFQVYKMAFLVPENEALTGEVHLVDIGLDLVFFGNDVFPLRKPRPQYHPAFIQTQESVFAQGQFWACPADCRKLW